MVRLRFLALLVAFGVLTPALAFQDKDSKDDKKEGKKDGKKEPPKLKGMLPPNFKKLGLTDKQVQTIYKLQADFKEKTDELKAKLDKLKKEERDKIEAVLSPEQMKRLKEIRSGEK